ncbi:hypothetical protein F4775DRAFT_185519 [Biscogniauxia sp. FL1348]|nr:hypothetical protein F4775DRAFT_185519 [Biscogniauxia sp. FL1348]
MIQDSNALAFDSFSSSFSFLPICILILILLIISIWYCPSCIQHYKLPSMSALLTIRPRGVITEIIPHPPTHPSISSYSFLFHITSKVGGRAGEQKGSGSGFFVFVFHILSFFFSSPIQAGPGVLGVTCRNR